MSENEQKNADNIFRKKFEEMLFKPPKANLDELRANVLQKNLQNKVLQNKLLKGSLAVITLLLGGSIYALWNKSNVPIPQNLTEKQVKIYLKDTVYVTKYENKYIKIPIYIYTKENIDKKLYASASNQIEETNEIHTLNISENNGKEENLIQGNIDKKITQNPNNLTLLADSKQEKSPNKTIRNELKTGNIGSSNSENLKINLDYLKAKQNENFQAWNIPKVKVNPKILPKTKPPRDKIPFLDRLAIGLNGGIEANKADVRIDAIEAFGLGDEEINNTTNLGLRVDFKLSEKVSLISGLEYQKINFEHEGDHKEQIMAVKGGDGNPLFLRHTIFGIAELPLNKMTANPKIGSFVNVEGEKGHFISSINIPLLLKYQFYEKVFSINQKWRGIKFYGIGGVKFVIPASQQLEIEIYEPNGHDFYENLTNFKNLNRYSALNFGFGFDFKYSPKMQVYLEPYYQSNLGSLVNNMPIRTYIKGAGIKFGINYSFAKK